ncbi:hypothetical protein [Flavobacterium sp.]|uniref:hypothetical protein n=1 Tax=Flavobacterium sp. TaxID=239 RepID=UPI00286DC063|nr:hypothetical protein [Flavobacterium sp.]
MNKATKMVKLIILMLVGINANAQINPEKNSFTCGEFKAGYAVNQFGSNLEQQYDAGNYGNSGGGLFTLAAYHKFESINHFNFGGKFSALGASPAKGDNENEMLFNFWGAAISAKYYPINKRADKGFNLYTDFYFITQFTQKYRNVEAKIFNHQFAIGNGLTFGGAYDFSIKKSNFSIAVEYGLASRTGEVTGVGDRTFKSSYFGTQIGFKF